MQMMYNMDEVILTFVKTLIVTLIYTDLKLSYCLIGCYRDKEKAQRFKYRNLYWRIIEKATVKRLL